MTMRKLFLGLFLALLATLPAQAQQSIKVKDATVTSLAGVAGNCVHADVNGKLGVTGTDCASGLASIADKRILANISGGSAAPVANTFSDILDAAITCSTQGDIIYRGSSGWSCLAPGTSTQFLKSGGAAANVSWATPSGGGNVTGPGSSTTHNCAAFADTSGTVLEDAGAGCGGGSGGGLPYGNISGPPASAGFSWVNQGSCTVAQAGGAGTPIMLTMPNDTGLNWRGRFVNQPATPYTLYAVLGDDAVTGGGAQNYGLYFTDGTKLMSIEFVLTAIGGAPSGYIRVEKITDVNTDGTTAAARPTGIGANQYPPIAFSNLFFRLGNDGSTLTFSYSLDGYNFVQLFSESVGTYITPTQIGFGGLNFQAVNTQDLHIYLLSWKTS